MVTAAAPAGMPPRPVTANLATWSPASPEPVRVSSTRTETPGCNVPAAEAGVLAATPDEPSSRVTQPAAASIKQDRTATSRRMRPPDSIPADAPDRRMPALACAVAS